MVPTGAVDPRELHVDQACRERCEGAVAGNVESVGEQIELAETPDQLDRVLAAVPPVVDPRQHLVGERAGVRPGREVVTGDVLEQGEVIGGAGQEVRRGGGRGVRRGDDGAIGRDGIASAGAGHQDILSMMRAMPCPPPTHRVARPKRPSRSRRPFSRVVVRRAPVEPQG